MATPNYERFHFFCPNCKRDLEILIERKSQTEKQVVTCRNCNRQTEVMLCVNLLFYNGQKLKA